MKYLFIVLLAFLLLSCGNNTKDKQKTILYLNKSLEFAASEEYLKIHISAKDSSVSKDESGKYILDEKNYRRNFNSVLEKKFNEIAASCGFKDFKDADSFVIEFKEDSEVKPLLDKYVQELKERHDYIEKEVNSSVNKMNQ